MSAKEINKLVLEQELTIRNLQAKLQRSRQILKLLEAGNHIAVGKLDEAQDFVSKFFRPKASEQ